MIKCKKNTLNVIEFSPNDRLDYALTVTDHISCFEKLGNDALVDFTPIQLCVSANEFTFIDECNRKQHIYVDHTSPQIFNHSFNLKDYPFSWKSNL